MNDWTIVKIKVGDGYRFDAVCSPIQTGAAIEFEDGEIIGAGDFEIVATGYTEEQVDSFYAALKEMTKIK